MRSSRYQNEYDEWANELPSHEGPPAPDPATLREVEKMNKRFVGRRVLIIGDHPHVDRVGTVDHAEKTLAGWGYVVKFPQGDSCFVFSGKHWRLL